MLTDGNGIAMFENLEVKKKYYMKETKNAKESMVKIEKYYGMYNGYYVGILYTTAPGYHHNDSIYDVEIMGYTFHYNWKKIKVWGKR